MKFNNKILALIFFGLVGLYLGKKTVSKPEVRSFRATLVEIDTAIVDRMHLYPEGSNGSPIELLKSGSTWTVSKDNMTHPATSAAVSNMMRILTEIKTKRLISKSKEHWADYELDENTAKRLEVYSGEQKVDAFLIGRFNFDQTTRSATTYMRKVDEIDIYSVDGFLSMSLDKKVDDFRDKQLFRSFDKENIDKIEYTSAGHNKSISRDLENNWRDEANRLVDSTSVSQYLAKLSAMNGKELVDDYIETPEAHLCDLTFVSDKQVTNNIKCYAESGDFSSFLLFSTLNPQCHFRSDSSGIYNSIIEAFLEL